MPNFVQTIRANKLPVLGLVPESSGTAPTAPVNGQLWIDTSVTPKLFKVWDGTVWAVANVYAGNGAANYAQGNLAEYVANKNAASGYAGLDAGSKIAFTQIPVGTTATSVAQGDLVERLANKNAVSGYAGLDAGSKIAFAQIPVGTTATSVAQGDLVERLANKNAASGYAGLDATSRIGTAQLPVILPVVGTTGAATSVRFVGGSAAAPTTGTFVTGDLVVGLDGSTYICIAGGTPGTWRRSLRDNELGAANGIATLGATGLVPIAQIPTGQTATTVPLGNDARFTDQRVPTDGSVTGGTAGAGVKIAAATITDVNVAAANKDGVAGLWSLRTLGSGAQQAAAGNDARLSDTRTPTAGSVVDASVAAGAAIAESKLSLATDAAAGTGSRRTLGTGALQAMAGSTTLSSIAAPTAAVGLGGFKITNLGAPTLASDAARLADVQAAAAGIDNKPSVRIASTGNVVIATNGLAAIDGVTPVAGDRVLLKNQTTTTENGVYVAAAGAWARDTDTITANSFWFSEEGTVNADTSWMVTTNGAIVLGTTALTIAQFGAATSYSGTANRVTITGSVIDIAGTYVGQTSITTLGTVTTGVWNGTAIAVANGGTGATAAAAARTNLGVAQVGYAATLGAVTAGTALVVTHNLGTQDVIAQVRDASTNEYIYLDVINASTTTVTITSGVAYAANALRIVILPVV